MAAKVDLRCCVLFVIFVVSGVQCGNRHHRRNTNELIIKPTGPHVKAVGKNLFFTCKANVPNPKLVKDLKWYKSNGESIPEDDRVYTEEQPGDAAVMLFIKDLREEDSGQYHCKGFYASTEEMAAEVQISTFIGITWDDAPTDQHAVINTDYKIRCVVLASPPATIDWLKESLIVSTGDRYVIETDGLLIKGVDYNDAGTYTCRARVLETGSLEERDIKLEVQTPPEWVKLPGPVKGIEKEKAEFACESSGIPHPHYTWVDQYGIDATDKEGWILEENTGHLIAYQLRREDEGQYTCIAENAAGRIEAQSYLDVVIRPKVQELYNKTLPINHPEGRLVCKASGDPLPDIIWRKWSRNEPLVIGGQPGDDRVFVEERKERAPDYTEGEEYWKVSELIINGLQRKDDGLYECQARNEGGQFFKSGHIQVEFPPTFEEQPMSQQWSWDQNPINLTCIATAIPNATITWWYRDREINREIIDRNYKVFGHGPRSDLIVTPLDLQYYGRYTCKAINPHGEAFTEIELKEAREPSTLQQAVTDKVTATTIQFRFVAPHDTGGLPIDSFSVEYKETTHEWDDAKRRVWPASSAGFYTLENLQPTTTYDLRFASKNLVGFSEWGAGKQLTMPQRGPPEKPRISTMDQNVENDVLNLTSPDRYELSWFLPEDNGIPIDFFEVSFYPVTYDTSKMRWERHGNLFRTEIPHPGNVRYLITNLYPNTHHLIEIRAHNQEGYSTSSALVIKTARGTGEYSTLPPFQETSIPLGAIIGAIVAILLLGFILVDLACFKINRTGITYMVCKRAKKKSARLNKKNKNRNHPPPHTQPILKDQTLNGGKNHEKDPLIHENNPKETVVTSTNGGRNGKASISVAKDSAV